MLVVPAVPGVLTAPGTYSVRAEKSSPFRGKLWIVFAVKVPLRVGSLVLRIGGTPPSNIDGGGGSTGLEMRIELSDLIHFQREAPEIFASQIRSPIQ